MNKLYVNIKYKNTYKTPIINFFFFALYVLTKRENYQIQEIDFTDYPKEINIFIVQLC